MTVLYDFRFYKVKQSAVLKFFVAFWIFVSAPMVMDSPSGSTN
jgi:hypothetical protein